MPVGLYIYNNIFCPFVSKVVVCCYTFFVVAHNGLSSEQVHFLVLPSRGTYLAAFLSFFSIFSCFRLCRAKLDASANVLSHMVHCQGLSRVCTRMCLVRSLDCAKDEGQT